MARELCFSRNCGTERRTKLERQAERVQVPAEARERELDLRRAQGLVWTVGRRRPRKAAFEKFPLQLVSD